MVKSPLNPGELAMIRFPARVALAVPFLASAALAYAQAGPAAGQWACMAGGKSVTIQFAGAEATVTLGSEKRVLKKQDTVKGSSYSDGTLGLKMRDPDPARNAALVDEYGTVTTLMRCIPAAG
jgi:hypothetical protein